MSGCWKMRMLVVCWFVCALFACFVSWVGAASVGIYGVGEEWAGQGEGAVDRVFVVPRADVIREHTAGGREVYLSLNVFGGKEARHHFVDSVPVLASGELLPDRFGGVCPTHAGWRQNRLELLGRWARELGGPGSISGVWLDFIRYPGRWEEPQPDIPDTCYCDRCLALFQQESGVVIPADAGSTAERAGWIRQNAAYQWLMWKKEQISSFVRAARAVLDEGDGERRLKLGAFVVPWRKSDHGGALVALLGQDAADFGAAVDNLSPMVYHRMVGQPVGWVEDISRYYRDMAAGQLWPIIQAEQVPVDEFGAAVAAVSASGADGLLVYAHRFMENGQWGELAGFAPPDNLIANPRFTGADGGAAPGGDEGAAFRPDQWRVGAGGTVIDSRFLFAPESEGGGPAVGIVGGRDRQGSWSVELPACRQGSRYRFTAEFYRNDRLLNSGYPEVRIWGQSHRLNTHRMVGRFQPLFFEVVCPDQVPQREHHFAFVNNNPGVTFWMRHPRLVAHQPVERGGQEVPAQRFFPLGVYGAAADNLPAIKDIGLNSAVVGLDEAHLHACGEQGLHCLVSVPREPERLMVMLERFGGVLQTGDFSFYVNDEPGIHSFPRLQTEDIQRLLKERFPDRFTAMAIVRPQVVSHYRESADYFMLDQYPVPHMPMSWLADSLDEAAESVGGRRLMAVIQAFGGERFAESGWPRLPTFAEMNCLAFLAVIHGSRGLYFYSFPEISRSAEGREDFARVIRRLNSLRSWLALDNEETAIEVRMTSPNRFDPQGRPAVHCASKRQLGTRLLMCANTIGTTVEAAVPVAAGSALQWRDYFGSDRYYVVRDELYSQFAPYEVKVLMENR
ncbi:hypothetical protein [Desulfofustis glycolicus]|uniref:Glycoside hydrolase family 42 N-terminal domain-containing protein n=1 Tax=Desulfofustis glycolicus DSM 9705 TaxID=1121409 RepID=A0A1M5VQ98_9BACT|nr:hypothetical protein [Desulfofustis glycolicus]SHH77348.1 hypothetical protein SAMN02745124_01807 [Desulfofustis glycolicus DSM 9705]